MIFFSTLIIASSTSWFSTWMGIEINLISFISFVLINKKISSIEASIIYFISQSMASILFLFSMIIYMTMISYSFLNTMFLNKLMIMALLMKMGSAPIHFWLPLVMEGLSWINNYLLMTWQKLAPMFILSYFTNYNFFLWFILLSAVMGSISGLNQTSIKKMMSFSSINQISWILMSLSLNILIWKVYMLFYFFLVLNVITIFHKMNLLFINQMFNMKYNLYTSLFFFFNILSMGGLPPFLGFYPKMLILLLLNNNIMMLFMIIFTLITLFYYLRLLYFNFLMKSTKILNMNYYIFNFKKLMITSFLSNFYLMLILLI